MRILYLYAELVGYQEPVLKSYVEDHKAEVHVVNWDKKKLKPYVPPPIEKVTFYKRSEYTAKELLALAKKIDPHIIFIAGWMDKGYLFVARHFKKKGIPVVTGFDDKWKGSLRQQAGSIFFTMYLKKYYTHAWVAGPLQFEYAKRFGFNNDRIVFDLLSGNTDLFSKAFTSFAGKRKEYPKTFLYVGNFRHVKGTDILIDAFKKYRTELNGKWDLLCVGNGDYRQMLNSEGVEVIDFSDQDVLVNLSQRCGAFILPSRHEQWGVVVHEFAAAGLPLIVSDIVGAKATFFIENFNGISCRHNSADALAEAMVMLSSKSDDELVKMGENSHMLSQRINPRISAASFISVLN